MPRDGNGDYTLPPLNPVQSGTTILSNWANSTMPDLGDAMTDSLSRSGQGGMLVAFKVVDGTLNTPAIGFQTEPSLGFYRPALGTIAFVSQSGETLRIRPSGNVSVSAAAPTNANDLTRKDYVDGLVNGLDGQNVKLTGDQSVGGQKTFTTQPLSTAAQGTVATALTRKDYVDAADSANAAAAAAAQAAADAAQADATTALADAGAAQAAADAAQAAADAAQGKADSSVQLTGDQTIAGLKTFTTNPQSNAAQAGAAQALTRKDYVDAVFPNRLAGYLATGLHNEYAGDLNAIVVNSKYYIDKANVTNAPDKMLADGVIETSMTDAGASDAVQLLTTMDAASNGAAFIRNRDGNVWSEWFPFGSGGGATISPTPPVDPEIGASWWDSDLGRAFVYYDDGTSAQWVEEDPRLSNQYIVTASGNFTPEFWDETLGVNQGTYSSQTGKWIRHGDLVTISVDLKLSSLGSLPPASSVRLGNLPFAGAAGWNTTLSVSYWDTLVTGKAFMAGYLSAAAFTVTCTGQAQLGVSTLLFSEAGGSFRMLASATYKTDDA